MKDVTEDTRAGVFIMQARLLKPDGRLSSLSTTSTPCAFSFLQNLVYKPCFPPPGGGGSGYQELGPQRPEQRMEALHADFPWVTSGQSWGGGDQQMDMELDAVLSDSLLQPTGSTSFMRRGFSAEALPRHFGLQQVSPQARIRGLMSSEWLICSKGSFLMGWQCGSRIFFSLIFAKLLEQRDEPT